MDPVKTTVLVIEDNPGDVTLLVEAFKENGGGEFEISHAFGFDYAMKMVLREKIDVILLDLSLPLFLGLEPLARIHKARPRIPVFILSGYNDPELAKEALKMGAKGYIVKNKLDGPALVQGVREAVEHRKQFQAKKSPASRAS